MTAWIDANKEKPVDACDLVIVYTGHSTWYAYWDEETGKWSDDNFESDMKVTHWMPFPDAPNIS